ncbi:MAG TPA: hypothetical protein VNH18_14655, partial [Bryobacteraceae bacterium]|nr:hypothetical protein [Bryobacteraceae bacterium]
GGGWVFPLAHVISTALEALFCTGCIVLVYQLCLRWFGRERLDSLMTTAQVLVAVAVIVGGQVAPQLIGRFGEEITFGVNSWWIGLLPPAWFAGFDDALAGHGAAASWVLAVVGLLATAAVLWLSFGKLAHDYETSLQALNETTSKRRPQRAQRRWIDALAHAAPLRWCLRDSVTRAAFLLTAAYLVRDRDVKLRIYPGLAPMLAMPVIFLVQDHGRGGFGGFGVAFAGAYMGLVPLLGLNLLQYSQQWQAADLFRAAPLRGPGALCRGAQWAVLCFLTLPVLAVFGAIAWIVQSDITNLALLLPGVIALPVYSLLPCLGGKAVPLSLPTEEAKSASRGLRMVGVMMVSMALSGAALTAWAFKFFTWFIVVESAAVTALYFTLRSAVRKSRWQPAE